VYLDHAASTPMWPGVIELVAELSADTFANPSGSHRSAREARAVIDEARESVADCIGARPSEVIWCSGGTEADNLAVLGLGVGGAVMVSAIEHPAVAEPAAHRGAGLAPVRADGVVDVAELESLLTTGTTLVSVMSVNNEIGTIQPLGEIAEAVWRSAPHAVLHTDAVQAAPWIDLTTLWPSVDALSISAHKFGGPKGAGALVVRDGVALSPRQLGGGQERDRRSGTQNVAGIAALALALRLTGDHRQETVVRVAALRDRLVDGVRSAIDGVVETATVDGDRRHRVAGSAHLCIAGIESEALLFLLDEVGIAASAGSSCASGAQQSSGVVAAVGVAPDLARGCLRLSLGVTTTAEDVDTVLRELPLAVARLRRTGS